MKYRIDEKSHNPAYLQLYKQLREDIVRKVYPYGSKLPSKRILAGECGVSVITTEHVYSILCDEGYVESRERSGYFVIYREKDFRSVGELQNTYSHHATQSPNSSKFPFSVLSKTMRKVLSEYGEDILTKSPEKGCKELQTAIASYLARSSGINVKSEQIIIGAGAEYLYNIIIQLLGNDKTYATEDPCYEKIKKVYLSCGITHEELKLGKDGILSSELENSSANILHTTPFHSYPSNISASASKKIEYIQWALKRKAIIIEENYDSELTVSKKAEEPLFAIAPKGMVIYLNTFSKTIAPSIRVGYMVLPENLLKIYNEKLGFYSCTVPIFEQYVLAELINNGDFERQINRIRRTRRKEQLQSKKSGHIKNSNSGH